MRVSFMVIGAHKCGTTSLARQLAGHPQICFCAEKEPGYFHKTDDWRVGIDDYHHLYSPRPGQICGEASTFYTFLPEWLDTHKRLYDYNPDLKFIYIMRQPVERIISHYAHNLVRSIDTAPPEWTVLNRPSYLNRSRYAVQIRPYLELFERENVLLLIFEEYTADQIAGLQQVAAFLEIDPQPFLEADTTPAHKSVGEPYLKYDSVRAVVKTGVFQKLRTIVPASIRQPVRHRLLSNKLGQKPELSTAVRRTLWRLLEDDVRAIEELLGRPLDVWRQGYAD
jgi:hypothetical protein